MGTDEKYNNEKGQGLEIIVVMTSLRSELH
uniref:Uncharacterized protein n=1 Tax=Rhizophora mucronata TaxID=61149 RepID=A0A2P2P9J0_RHIMU